MNKKSAFNIFKNSEYNNVSEVSVKKNYFLVEHSHNFKADKRQLEIITNRTANLLGPESRYKLKKNTIYIEKKGKDDVFFLSSRLE